MNDESKGKENEGTGGVIVILGALGVGLLCLLKISLRGATKINFKSIVTYFTISLGVIVCLGAVLDNFAHIRLMQYIFGDVVSENIFYWMVLQGKLTNAGVLFLMGTFLVTFFMGFYEVMLCKRYENAIKEVGLKNALGESPKVRRVIKIDDERSILKVHSPGLGAQEWEKKKENLAFSFKSYVDLIKTSPDMKYIDILISTKDLPKVIRYADVEANDTGAFTFLVGKSKEGLVNQSIRSCPHFLMGGATGMGKSTAFKLMIYSFLKNSPPEQLHMCLLDLKKGVEVSDFKTFPNVEIAKTEAEALVTLRALVKEMNRRWDIIAAKEQKSIEPARDKVPLIIVAVDEASVIFGTTGRSKENRKMANEARALCEEIGKLGRAAGIHLILATQRATKSSIDTVTMDNLEARLSFRTRSVSGSTALLGDKSGMTLPDTPGRAIWQKGVKSQRVQVPFIEEDDLTGRCKKLADTVNEEYQETKFFSLTKVEKKLYKTGVDQLRQDDQQEVDKN